MSSDFRALLRRVHTADLCGAAIAAQAIVWVSTVAIQLPLQFELSDHGLSVELIERLIETNFWLRRIPYAMCAGLFLWMAAQVMGASGDTGAR